MSDPPRRERRPAAERAKARKERRERSIQPTTSRKREPAKQSRHRPETRQRVRTTSTRSEAPPRPQPQPVQTRQYPPTRSRVLVRRTVAISVAATVVGLVLSLFFSPLLGVDSVTVNGAVNLSTSDVLAAADVQNGTPMLRLDTGVIAARVRQLPRVATVDVSRDWPATVRIDITERVPVAYAVLGNGIHLVDRTGLDYATVTAPPPGLPKLTLTTLAPTDPRTAAAVAVLGALPRQLRALVLTVGAQTPGSVTLGLTGGRTIRWGSAADSALKAQVIAALMTQPGKVYDVSSPELPTIS